MSPRATLEPLIESLSEDAMRQLIDFARLLACEDERETWQRFGRSQLAQAYGPSEPGYTESDIKPHPQPDSTT